MWVHYRSSGKQATTQLERQGSLQDWSQLDEEAAAAAIDDRVGEKENICPTKARKLGMW